MKNLSLDSLYTSLLHTPPRECAKKKKVTPSLLPVPPTSFRPAPTTSFRPAPTTETAGAFSPSVATLSQLNPEGSPPPHLGTLDVNLAAVIFLDNALSQRQTKSPAALLGSETRLEDIAYVFLTNALAGI